MLTTSPLFTNTNRLPVDNGALLHLEQAKWTPSLLAPLSLSDQASLIACIEREIALSASSPGAAVTLPGVKAGYAAALRAQLGATWSRVIASSFPSDSPIETYPWLRGAPAPRKWVDERTARELQSDKVAIVSDDYETSVEFRAVDLRRDKTGQMVEVLLDMATRVAFYPELLLSALLVANGNAYDGVTFFNASHSVGGVAINNSLGTGDGLAGGSSPTVAQQITNIGKLLAQLMAFRDADNQPMNAAARQFVVMVPPGLFPTTVQAINTAFVTAASSNPALELARIGMAFMPVCNPLLTASDETYLFRVDGGARALIVQDDPLQPVELGPDSEHAAKTKKVLFGHGWRGGAGYGRFEFAIKGKLS